MYGVLVLKLSIEDGMVNNVFVVSNIIPRMNKRE